MQITVNAAKMVAENNITVMCAGWFDLFHVGHLEFLKQAKACGNKLIVVVMSDRDGKFAKGPGRPFINERERLRIVDSVKYVDYTLLVDQTEISLAEVLSNKDMVVRDHYLPIIQKVKPHVVYSLKETLQPCGFDSLITRWGARIEYSDRNEGTSTTGIAQRIRTTPGQ